MLPAHGTGGTGMVQLQLGVWVGGQREGVQAHSWGWEML